MKNNIKWILFVIGTITLAILTFMEFCMKELTSFVEKNVAKCDPRSLEEQTESFIKGMYKYCEENFPEKVI